MPNAIDPRTAMTGHIAVEVTDESGIAGKANSRPPDELLASWVSAALATTDAGSDGNIEVGVLIADSETVRSMNRDYRGKDKPTNVLSFPVAPIEGLPPDAARPLGDIVLCLEVIGREAREQGKREADHWAHLCVHGALHLAGYDHEDDREAAEMEALEVRILANLGIADPYATA